MGARDRISPDPANSRQQMHCYIRRRSFPELISPARSRQTDLRKNFIFACEKPEDRHQNKARPAAPTPPVTPAGSPGKKTTARIMRTRRTAAGGGGHHRSTHSSMATGEGHQAPAKQPCRPASPPAPHHLPWSAAAETLSSPSSFDGRGAATAAGAGSSGGLWGSGLRGGCAGEGRSSAAAREGGGRGGRVSGGGGQASHLLQ